MLFVSYSLFLLFTSSSLALRCYEGSKGIINGVESSNFVEKDCDEGMIHCFSSYNDDLSDVTAACQTPSTEEKLIDVCKSGCVHHGDINVTVCCCDSNLCNSPIGRSQTTLSPAANSEDFLNDTQPAL